MSQIGENAYFWKQSRVLLCRGHRDLLAAMRATSHPAWAALSTYGLGTLDLPKDIRDVIVLADGDADQTQHLLDGLVKAGWLRPTSIETSGRRKYRWQVNPRIHSPAESAESAERV